MAGRQVVGERGADHRVAKHLSAAGLRQHTEGVRVGERRRHFRGRTAERRDEVVDPELGTEQGRGGLQHVANRPGQEVKPATDRLTCPLSTSPTQPVSCSSSG
jgi:hypothetical protein